MPFRLAMILLFACACRHSAPPQPEPTAEVMPPTSSGLAGIGSIRALAERLDGGFEGPIVIGQSSGEAGTTRLRVDSELLFELDGKGADCPAELAIPLILFEGPEAFLLVGTVPPRIVALTRDTEQPRCWPLAEFPRLPPTQTPLLSLTLAGNYGEEPPTAQQASIELLAEHPGPERLELEPSEDGPLLRLMSEAGEQLLHWEAVYGCEYDDSLTVDLHGHESGYMLVLDRYCDHCAPCEHARETSNSTIELWWQPGTPALEARATYTTSEAHDSWQQPAGVSVIAEDSSFEAQAWPLGPTTTIMHELGVVRVETTHYHDDDDDDDEERVDNGEIHEERWVFQSGPGEWVVRFRSSRE